MKCKNCGKDIPPDSSFCVHCGIKVESIEPAKVSKSKRQEQQYNQYDNYQPYYGSNKSNTGLKVTIVILSTILFVAVAFGVWYFVIRSDKDDNENSDEEIAEKTIPKKDENDTASSHSLSCDYEGEIIGYDAYTTMTFEFNNNETKVKKVIMKMTVYIPEDQSALKEEMKEKLSKSFCKEKDLDKCDITIKSDKVLINASSTSENVLNNYDGYSLNEVRKNIERAGGSCK